MKQDGRIERFHPSEEQAKLAKGYWDKVRIRAADTTVRATGKTRIKKRGKLKDNDNDNDKPPRPN
jgi:hypothetical protein